MAPQIIIRELSKRFGNLIALNNVNANIQGGLLTGLVGPDGAGKTTLMRILAGLMAPTSGSLEVAGHDAVREAAAIHRVTGYMPQRFGLYQIFPCRKTCTSTPACAV